MLVVLKAKPVVLLRTRPAAEPLLLLSKVFAWYLVEVVLVAESLAAVAAVAEVEFAEAPDACVSQRLVVPWVVASVERPGGALVGIHPHRVADGCTWHAVRAGTHGMGVDTCPSSASLGAYP